MDIYVGNLSYTITVEELRDAFEQHGEVSNVKIVTDRDTGRSKGFGFVEMPNEDEAEAAIEELNGAMLKGRNRARQPGTPTQRPRQKTCIVVLLRGLGGANRHPARPPFAALVPAKVAVAL